MSGKGMDGHAQGIPDPASAHVTPVVRHAAPPGMSGGCHKGLVQENAHGVQITLVFSENSLEQTNNRLPFSKKPKTTKKQKKTTKHQNNKEAGAKEWGCFQLEHGTYL